MLYFALEMAQDFGKLAELLCQNNLQKLGWTREYRLEELANEMMASDLKLMTKDVYFQECGYKIMSYFE